MIIFLLLLSISLSSGRSLFSKSLGMSMASLPEFCYMNGMISSAAIAVLALSYVFEPDRTPPSAFTIALSAAFAAATISAQYFYMKALALGPMPVGTLVYSCGFIIPAVAGTLIWSEKITPFQVFGMLILPAALYIYIKPGERRSAGYTVTKEKGKGKVKWLLCAAASALFSGTVGLMQKLHQKSVHRGETGAFLLMAFAVTAAVSFAVYAAFRMRVKKSGRDTFNNKGRAEAGDARRLIMFAVLNGMCVGGANKINLFLSGALPSMIFFPAVNGGVVILSGILGHAVFGEKLSVRETAGLALGIAAICLAGNIVSLL